MIKDIFNRVKKKIRRENGTSLLSDKQHRSFCVLTFVSVILLSFFWAFFCEKQIIVSFDATAGNDIYYQVFYTQNAVDAFGPLVEGKKVSAGNNHIEIVLPTKKIAKFRLDLGSFPQKVIIKNLKIKGIYSIAINDSYLLKLNQLEVYEGDKGEFEFYSNQGDPYFVYTKDLNLSTKFKDFIFSFLIYFLICLGLCKFAAQIYRRVNRKKLDIFSKESLILFIKNVNFKETFFISSFLLLYFVYYLQPSFVVPLNSYIRIMGRGVVNNYDVTLVIKNFYIFFLEIGILYLLMSYTFTHMYKYLDTYTGGKSVKDGLDNICVVGICYCLLCYLAEINMNDVFERGILNIILAFVLGKIFLLLSGIKISMNKFNTYLYGILCLSVYLSISLTHTSDIATTYISTMGIFLIACYVFPKIAETISKYDFNLSIAILLCIPLYTSLFFEMMYILNRNGIFISNVQTIYTVSLIILCSVAFIDDIKNKSSFDVTKLYSIVVVGFAFLSVQMPLIRTVGVNLFETANSSISISSLLYNGELPVFQHFGAHMLQSVLSGIFYGIINNDYEGAILSPYSNYFYIPIVCYLFYYISALITKDKDVSLTASLFLPITSITNFFAAGMWCILPVCAYVKKMSYTNAMMIMASFVVLFLYRIDIAVSFIIASGVALLWAADNRRFVYKLILTGAITLTVVVILYCIICIFYGISPIERMQEFIYIANSNANWAYDSVFGEKDIRNFNIFYILLPITIICSLIYTMFSGDKFKSEKLVKVILIVLGSAYIINFQRGLIRHSLLEKSITFVMWSGYFYIICFLVYLYSNKKLFAPLIILTLFVKSLCMGSPIDNFTVVRNSVRNIGNISRDIGTLQDYSRNEQIIQRVKLTDDISSLKQEMKLIMDTILEPNETYLDFSNHSFLYSLLKRRSPVYVSQSPGLLSGEESQEIFIKEILSDMNEIPIALLPFYDTKLSMSIDGILNNMRYYKVAEFIYQNYRPLLRNEQYVFWARNDKYEYLKTKAGTLSGVKFVGIDYCEKTPYFHSYNLKYLAYLWGSLDKKNAGKNKIQRHLIPQQGNRYVFEVIKDAEKEKGNYISLKITSPFDSSGILYLGTAEQDKLIKFAFNVKQGGHTYLFRVSADSLWYFTGINNIELDIATKFQLDAIDILEGD